MNAWLLLAAACRPPIAVDTAPADTDVADTDVVDSDTDVVDTDVVDSDTDVVDSDTDVADTDVSGPMPDFSLYDRNPSSVRYGAAVSPRDYITKVSGFYFTHAT